MDSSSSTPVAVPAPAQTPPPQSRPAFDPMEQNQNYGTAMMPPAVNGVQTTSFAQPQPVQQKGQESTPNPCCCCERRVGLAVLAAFEVVFQACSLGFFSLLASNQLGDGCSNSREKSSDCGQFYVAVLFFICLALTSSLVLLFTTCCIMKKLSVVSHVVGWIPILAACLYASIYHSTNKYTTGLELILGPSVTIGLVWRTYESFVVYYYWEEVPGQYATHSHGNTHGQTNYDYATRGYGGYGNGYTPAVVPPNYGYAQPGYGAYGQPGGYNYGGGGYGGFGQPGYGGYAGYGGFGQPVGGYNHV